MESPDAILGAHWRHEPVGRAYSRAGKGCPRHGRIEARPAIVNGRRFMESEHLRKLDVGWGHEPGRQRAADVPSADRFQNCRQDAGSTLRFMESEHIQNLDAGWGHEPVGIPLNRPPGTFSPSGGEGWDERLRFMGREANRFHSAPSSIRGIADQDQRSLISLLS